MSRSWSATASVRGQVARLRPFALLDEAGDRSDAERAALNALLPALARELRTTLRATRAPS